jgi:hypothetical protein
MGLLERVAAGTVFSRKTITIPTFSPGVISGSIQTPGGTYIILNATANRASRLRLYADSASVNVDLNRSPTTFDVSSSVGLVADINFTGATTLNLDPPIIGNTFQGGETWYLASGSTGANTSISFEVYSIGTIGDSTTDRSVLNISGSSISTTGYGVSGSISTKKSFILLSGSATSESRLRLYSTTVDNVPVSEQTRLFGTASVGNSKLIADFMFDSANTSYKFVPVLEAYTWQNDEYNIGTGVVGYQLENRSAGTSDITASLYIYSTEE